MPELPEVETTKRGVEPFLKNKIIKRIEVRNSSLRVPVNKTKLKKIINKKIIEVGRKGKYIFLQLNDESKIIIHLGMSGTLRVHNKFQKLKHDHVILKLETGQSLIFNDTRRFGLFHLVLKNEEFSMFENNGPDPLSQKDGKYFYNKIKNSRSTLKALLLNNKIISGIGNIYASEILFLSRLSPKKSGNKVTKIQCDEIIKFSKIVLNRAIKFGGTTLNDYHNAENKPGYFKIKLFVYDREGQDCKECKSKIFQIRQNNRSTYFCKNCQS